MIDRLKQMAIFAKVVEHGSFRAAAHDLHLSPSVVSSHISQLEDHLGVAILYRSTRKLALTPQGEQLLAATQKMLRLAEAELTSLTAHARDPSGELKITLPSVLSHSDLPQKIAGFSREYPRIRLNLNFTDARQNLVADGFDLAIRMGTDAKNSATHRKLFNVNRRIIVARNLIKDAPTITQPNDLLQFDWLLLGPVQNVPLVFTHKDKKSQTLRPNGKIGSNDVIALSHLAKEGAGVAIVPEFLLHDDLTRHVQVVLPDWELQSITAFANWPSNAPKHGLIHLLLDWLSKADHGTQAPRPSG